MKTNEETHNRVKCDGWCADLGCEKVCEKQEWSGRYGGKNLCKKCADRWQKDLEWGNYITG